MNNKGLLKELIVFLFIIYRRIATGINNNIDFFFYWRRRKYSNIDIFNGSKQLEYITATKFFTVRKAFLFGYDFISERIAISQNIVNGVARLLLFLKTNENYLITCYAYKGQRKICVNHLKWKKITNAVQKSRLLY